MMHVYPDFFFLCCKRRWWGTDCAGHFLLAPFGVLEVFFLERNLSSPLDSCHADLAGAPRSIFWKPVSDNSLIPKLENSSPTCPSRSVLLSVRTSQGVCRCHGRHLIYSTYMHWRTGAKSPALGFQFSIAYICMLMLALIPTSNKPGMIGHLSLPSPCDQSSLGGLTRTSTQRKTCFAWPLSLCGNGVVALFELGIECDDTSPWLP